MKKFSLVFALVVTFFVPTESQAGIRYQVITSHPHDLDQLNPHVKTVQQTGRLRIVEVNPRAPSAIMNYLRPVSGRERSYLVSHHSKREGDSGVTDVVKQVSMDLIKSDIVKLASYPTRYAGTPENRESVKMVKAKLESFGLKTQDVCHATNACSLVAEKAGMTHPEEVILVIAHVDSVGQKFAGADDNGSGTAALVEMARVLSKVENKRTFRFFVTNGEELGLLGAEYYAAQLKKQGKIKEIVLAINMDMVGYNSNGIVELETDSQYESMAKWYAEVAATYTSLKTKITIGAWGSDHVPFIKAGAPTLLTIEYWDTKTPCYHQACDTPDTVNYPYATEITKLNVAAVLTKDSE